MSNDLKHARLTNIQKKGKRNQRSILTRGNSSHGKQQLQGMFQQISLTVCTKKLFVCFLLMSFQRLLLWWPPLVCVDIPGLPTSTSVSILSMNWQRICRGFCTTWPYSAALALQISARCYSQRHDEAKVFIDFNK